MTLFREFFTRLRQTAFRRDVTWTLAGFAVYAATGVLQTLAVSRHLGPEAKGSVTIIIVGPTVVGWMLSLGLGPASMYLASTRRPILHELLTSSFITSVVLGAISAILGWYLLAGRVEGGVLRTALALAFAMLPLLLMRETHGAMLLGVNEIRLYNQAAIAARVAGTIPSVAAVYLLPESAFFVVVALSQGLSNALVVAIADWHFRWRIRWDAAVFREQLLYGLRSHAGRIAEIGSLRLDYYVVAASLGTAKLGLYSIAVLVSETLIPLAQSSAALVFGRVATAPKLRGFELARLAVLGAFVALAAFAVPVAMFAAPLVDGLFGPGFRDASTAVAILAVATVAQGTARVAVWALRALGSPTFSSAVQLLGLVATIPLVFVLIPVLDINGAAIASLVAYSLSAIAAVGSIAYLSRKARATIAAEGSL